jgi:hypothetical protein
LPDLGVKIVEDPDVSDLAQSKIEGWEQEAVQKVKFLIDAEIEKEYISKSFEIPKSVSTE